MKKILGFGMLALALAGCSAITDIGKVSSPACTEGGAKPIATISVQNVSYQLFGCIPIASGTTWKGECPYDERPSRNTEWFCDNVSPDDNIESLKAALKECGSNKVMNFVTLSECWSSWSIWIVWQKFETTTCTVLK